MDSTNETIPQVGCAVDDSIIPSLMSVLSIDQIDSEAAEDAPFDEMGSSVRGSSDRRGVVSPAAASSRVRLRNNNNSSSISSTLAPSTIPEVEHSKTPDTEESSAFSSTAVVINQVALNMLYEETSDMISRRRDDVNSMTRRFIKAFSMDDDENGITKSTLAQAAAFPSKSTASYSRSRIRKSNAKPDATIVSSNSFPPLSPSINQTFKQQQQQQNEKTGSNNYSPTSMFSYKNVPPRNDHKSSISDNQRQLRQQDSLVSFDTPPASPLRQEATNSVKDVPFLQNNNRSSSDNTNLVHRIPPRDHSALNNMVDPTDQTPRLASSFVSRQSDAAGSTHMILVTRSYEVKEHVVESIFYVSASAILGSIVRTYSARIFGMDCELKSVHDFLTPSSICVTNGGRTNQTGGALFYDFPANVLGSFILGLITPHLDHDRSRFPWLHKDHALQRDDVFHASLGTGFCGCMTTFASWNTQMVVMLDGTYCELGPQVISVFFGYIIGLMGASSGFRLGRQCGLWMHNFRHAGGRNSSYYNDDSKATRDEEDLLEDNPIPLYREPSTINQQGVELVDVDDVKLQPVPNHLHKIPLFLVAAGFLAAFLVGNFVQGIQFYRGMTILWFVAPLGSLLRWKLSEYNLTEGRALGCQLPKWIPWGTFVANMLAAFTTSLLAGIEHRYFSDSDPTESNWTLGVLFALSSGFAGSLSTVSTMIKESVVLSEQHVGVAKAHYYAVGTCFCGMLLGLAVYATTVRINA